MGVEHSIEPMFPCQEASNYKPEYPSILEKTTVLSWKTDKVVLF